MFAILRSRDDHFGLSLPVTLIILLIAFGAIIAAGVPVLLALSAVGSATGLAALASLLGGCAVGPNYHRPTAPIQSG